MAAVNQHGQLNSFGPAQVVERVEGRAGGASTEQHVVHEHDRLAGDVERNHCWMDLRSDLMIQVVAVHGDVEAAHGNRMAPNTLQQAGEASGQMHTTPLHTHQHHLRARLVPFGDFVGDARQRPAQRPGVQNDGWFRHKKIERVRRTNPFDGRKSHFASFLRDLAGSR